MNLQTFIDNFLGFLNSSIIPFILAVAFIVFLWNIVRYFVFSGSDEKEHENARSVALWGIAAFVIILSLWGIVNLFVYGFDLAHVNSITPDYMQQKSGSGSSGNSGQTFPSENDANYTLPGQYVTPE